jgi:cellulose synthase operon protein C
MILQPKCPSCTATYDLDSNRVPAQGLKMRCPKCGATFRVLQDGTTAAPDAIPSSPPTRKPTQQGVGPASSAPQAPDAGEARFGKPRADPTQKLVQPPARPQIPVGNAPQGDLPVRKQSADLPALKMPPVPPPRRAMPTKIGAGPPQAPPPPRPIAPPIAAPIAPPVTAPLADRDLPSRKQQIVDLPQPVGPNRVPTTNLPARKAEAVSPQRPPSVLPSPFAPGVLSKSSEPPFDLSDLQSEPPGPRRGYTDLDLPLPGTSRSSTPIAFDDLDLPLPSSAVDLPRKKTDPGEGGVDLPVLRQQDPDIGGFGELDLPVPASSAGIVDLPVLGRGGATDLPALKGVDLPKLAQGGVDLPMPQAYGRGSVDLPMPQVPGRGSVDLPMPQVAGRGSMDLPVPAAPGGGLIDLPGAQSAGRGSVDFPRLQEDGFGSLDLPIPQPAGSGSVDFPGMGRGEFGVRQGAGGVQFGEIDLGAESNEAMEFADLPQEREAAPATAGEPELGLASPGEKLFKRQTVVRPAEGEAEPRRGRGRTALLGTVFVLLLLVIGGGVALGFTQYGYFGTYYLEQFLPEAGSASATERTIAEAETLAASDTYADVRGALSKLGAARHDQGLNRRLLARSLLHEALYQIRFGTDPASTGREGRIIARLEQRSFDAPGIDIARAAYFLRQNDLSQAERFVGLAQSRTPDDPYVHLVAGELALVKGDAEAATTAFQAALDNGGAARAQWGLARAAILGGQADAASAAIDATLAASPRHARALLAKARNVWQAGDRDAALALAEQAAGTADIDGERVVPSATDRAAAWTLIGRIHERAGNRGRSREAYERALEANPIEVDAMLGNGRLLLGEGRYRDALARFQSVIDSGLDHPGELEGQRSLQTEAKLGAARAMIELEMAQEARGLLEELLAQEAEDPDAMLYLGKVSEAAGDRTAAEQFYRDAIRVRGDRFDGYLALAQLFFAGERTQDADEVLRQARERVAESAEMRRMLGDMELARSSLAAAETEYRRALELDPNDLAARFSLGVTLRRSGKLEEAEQTFDQVARRDDAWPGLALERGLLFEAEGQGDRAVQAYERALAERPTDIDLQLRLGAALVSANRIDEAEAKLEQVMRERPNSAEAEHFMGRVLFARGDLPEAMTHLVRAVSLDASRAEFHLYVAWVALEQGNNLGRALEEVQAALERDASLADAYWIRGRIYVLTGAVRDAIDDLERALELKPGRYQAWASMGEAYESLRDFPRASQAYERALEQDGDQGSWWQRLGQIRMDSGDRAGAVPALVRAVEIGAPLDPAPNWLLDAHRVLGDAYRLGGDDANAIVQYRRYMELAPSNALDLEEVRGQLEDYGITLEED